MSDLERCGDWLLDNKNHFIVNIVSSTSIQFDFKKMCFKEGKKQTLKPVQYDPIKKVMTYWANQRWCTFSTFNAEDAVQKLYDNYFEDTFFGDD